MGWGHHAISPEDKTKDPFKIWLTAFDFELVSFVRQAKEIELS